MNEFWKNPDLLVRTGSHLYGCATPTSDEDTRGFVVPSALHLLGRAKFELYESREPDMTIWSFQKFFHLLETGSPNVIELLFVPANHILRASPVGQKLLDSKHLFLSKQNVKPIQGFALSEWKKAVQYFDNLNKIGERRMAEINTVGYSIKNAYHAIRLMWQLHELLTTGKITFPRPEAFILKDIRNGNCTIEELTHMWDSLDRAIPGMVETSVLPEQLDRDRLNDLYVSLIRDKIQIV